MTKSKRNPPKLVTPELLLSALVAVQGGVGKKAGGNEASEASKTVLIVDVADSFPTQW